MTTTGHAIHGEHTHDHGPDCGHASVEHEGHSACPVGSATRTEAPPPSAWPAGVRGAAKLTEGLGQLGPLLARPGRLSAAPGR